MFIYHFNRLIHNKIVWGTLAFVIAIAFGLGGVSAAIFGGCQSGETIGKLNGKPLSLAELVEAETAVRLAESLQRRGEPLSVDVVRTQALNRIAMQRLAARNHLAATTPEIQSQISQIPDFQINGVFDKARYQQVLRQLRMTPDQFAGLVALSITDEKINALVSSASWISPAEANDYLASVTDRLTVQYATLADRFATDEMNLSEEKVQAFYDQNPDLFMVPDQTAVDYIAIPITNYYARLAISEHDLREQYEDNLNQYMRVESDGTNDVPVQASFESVTNEIHTALIYARALYAAETNAIFTLLDMAQAARGLQAVADHVGIEIETTNLFGVEGPAGIENSRQFARTVNEDLDLQSIGASFGIFLGANYLYLFTPAANAPAHLPALDDIRDRVVVRATAKARNDAFLDEQDFVHKTLQAYLDAGKTFAEAAEAAQLTASDDITLVVRDVERDRSFNPEFPEFRAVAFTAMSLAKGQLSKPAPSPRGGVLFVHMIDREPGDPLTVEEERDQRREYQSRSKSMLVAGQWREWFTGQLDFKRDRGLD